MESAAVKERLAKGMAAAWQEQLAFDGQDQKVIGIRLCKSQERITSAPMIVVACLYLAELDAYPDPNRAEAERIMAIQSLGAAVQNFLLHIYAERVRCRLDVRTAFLPGRRAGYAPIAGRVDSARNAAGRSRRR